MIELSPLIYAGNATTPTLFLHGELDHRVPIAEAEQMYVALKKQRVPAMFIRYPDSYHGGWTPWRTVHSWHYEMEWWRKYLRDKPSI
jgi:dipeptidyl aminopeptidase/acylaminoacyl peptidase